MNILVIGAGYWGQKLIERFGNILGVARVGIYDKDPIRVSRYLGKGHFSVQGIVPHRPWLKGDFVDAVAIATPISTHYQIAREWLAAGKHVFVEKPLAQTAEQARELGRLAKEKGLVLMTDMTFLEDPRVARLAEQTLTGMLWAGPKSKTSRENIFWTWAPHPLSIALAINGEPSHMGAVWLPHEDMDRVYIALHYDKAPGHCNILMQWGEGIRKERWLFIGARPGLSKHLDLTLTIRDKKDPLRRICLAFVAAVDGGLPSGFPQAIWTGVRVAEIMAWIDDEFLTPRNAPTIKVKKWEPTTK